MYFHKACGSGKAARGREVERKTEADLLPFRLNDDHDSSTSSIKGNSPKYLSKSL